MPKGVTSMPPVVYTAFVAKTNSKLRLGIDLGGSKIFVALLNGHEIIASDKKRTKGELGYEGVRERIVKLARKVCKEADVIPSSLASVGVGVPSPVVRNRLLHAPNLGWRDPPLAKDIAKELKVDRVSIGNDVNCGALGEARHGAVQTASSVFALFVGTGLGGGWVHQRKVHEGTTGFAGEVGHLRIPGESGLCGCGQTGCLETIASKRGLQRMLNEAKAAGTSCAIEDLSELRSSAVDAAYRGGCPATTEALQKMARHLAWAMNVIACVINPDVFVIGGGIGERLGQDLLPLIDERRRQAPFIFEHGAYQVHIGSLGPAAVAMGAAAL